MRTRLRKELLTIEELAKVARVSKCTVRRAIAAGLKTYPGKGRQLLVCRSEWEGWRGARAVTVEAAVEKAVSTADADALETLKAQLLVLKRTAFNDLQAVAAGEREVSPAAKAAMGREFSSYADALRKLEHQLPMIQAAKNQYVDCKRVGAILGRAGAILASELDGLGVSLAEKLVGMDVRQIRDTIDDGVNRARGKLTDELQRLIDAKGN